MSDEQAATVETEETQATPEQTEPTFMTKEDVEKIIQSATDRVRTEYVQKLKATEAEAEDLKKQAMSEKERVLYEKEAAEQKAADLQSRFDTMERKALITEGLASNNIDPSAMGLMREPKDGDELTGWVANFNARVESEVQKRVNERLAGTPQPKSGNQEVSVNYQGKKGEDMSKEEFYAYLADTLQE